MARAFTVSVLLVVIAALIYIAALVGPRFADGGLAGGCADDARERVADRSSDEVVYWPPGIECRTERKNGAKVATSEWTWAPPAIVGLGGAAVLVMVAGAYAATRRPRE